MFKKEKGITLIALVVTIIILLILAGVTLSLALSENGLFDKTKDAAEEYQSQANNETNIVNYIYDLVNEYDGEDEP